MKRVLEEDTVYPYLKGNAVRRLDAARQTARNTGMLRHSLVHLGGYSWCLFPWLGTRSFRTFRKILASKAPEFGISNIEFEGCNYITFRMERGNDYQLISCLAELIRREAISPLSLVSPKELPVFEKYDDYIPAELLRYAYAEDRLNVAEAGQRIADISGEF